MDSNKLATAKELDSKIDYEALEQQRAAALQANLKYELRQREVDAGKIHSLRRYILRLVVETEYDKAAEITEAYVEAKRIYPAAQERLLPQMQHAHELINAIRAKRNFPGMGQLSMSKQQEILDFAIQHFEELKTTLKMMEQISRDEAVKDIRSTEWVLRTGVYTMIAVVGVAFFYDMVGGLGQSVWIVSNILIDQVYAVAQKFIPFL